MDNANPLAALMIGRSRTLQDLYTPACEEEEMDKPKYLAAVVALFYIATFIRPDISFAVSVLVRQSHKSTVHYWVGIKYLFRYLRSTKDLGLLYSKHGAATFEGYVDVGYKIDPKTGK